MTISKLDSKRPMKDSKLDVIEIGESDNIENIIMELNNNIDVEYAQPNYKLISDSILPVDPYFVSQWGLKNTGQTISGQAGTSGIDINVSNVWDTNLGSKDLVIGVIDSGVDIRHPDLAANIYKNLGEISSDGIDNDNNGYIDDVSGWDFAHGDNTVFDSFYEDDHGTHVSGIIAAVKDTKGVVGVAPNVKIMPLKFLVGEEGGYTSDAIEAISYAKKMNIKIINCSWGGPNANLALKEAMESSDILFISAAGNEGVNIDITPTYPAGYSLPNMITVGAIDNTGSLASFSNYGTRVHVAAPGWNILSTLPNNTYDYYDGTSMAAPYVAGIAALLKSAKPAMTAPEMAAAIKAGVNKTSLLNGKVSTGGMVDAELAVFGIKAPTTTSATSTDSSISINWGAITNAASYDVRINGEIINLGKVITYTKTGLTPNTIYKYSIRAKSTTATSGWSIEKSITTKTEGYMALDFIPTDSVMHPTEPIVYITDKTHNMIHKINYATKTKTSVSLDLPPERIKLVNNELYVTLLKGEHSSYWWEEDQSGAFVIINPDDMSIKDRYDIDIDPFDIEVDSDGYIYVSSGSGQHTLINSYSRLSKVKVAQRIESVYERSYLRYNEAYNKLYNINSGQISPNDIESNTISRVFFQRNMIQGIMVTLKWVQTWRFLLMVNI
jgi:subtilisin family serine protease